MRILLYYVRVVLVLIIFILPLSAVVWFLSKNVISSSSELGCYRCNVIFISIDDFGAKHSSVYDPTRATSPFLSELADSRAIVFNHAYANAPWTLPSHTAMFTGSYPWTVGISTLSDKLPPDIPTIFTFLATHGYDTVAFSDGPFVHPIWGTTNGIATFQGSIQYKDWGDIPALFTNASTWLTSRKGNKPFFLLLHPFGVHDPYGAPGTSEEITPSDIVDANTQSGGPTTEQVTHFQSAYENAITRTDEALRAFFAALDASPYAKNTIVVIVSDHGEEFNEHGNVAMHGSSVYNEVLHVPLLIVLPGAKARRINQTVELRSLPSTIMELTGYDSQHAFPDSASLVPMMRGKNVPNMRILSGTDNSKEFFLKVYGRGPQASTEENTAATVSSVKNIGRLPLITSVVQGNLHLIKRSESTFELYNIEKDPDEKENLYRTPEKLTYEEQERLKEMLFDVVPPK